MRLALVTPPAQEPVSLAEAKAHLRLEGSEDDAYVTALIQTAREHVEQVCWRALVTQTWDLVLDAFPARCELELPFGHLAAVVSVTYVDSAGVEQTLPPASYEADTASVPGRLVLAYGASWPATRAQWNAVRVRYTVGWAQGQVPAGLKQALLLLVGQLYEQRTVDAPQALSRPSFTVDALLSPYRLVRLA